MGGGGGGGGWVGRGWEVGVVMSLRYKKFDGKNFRGGGREPDQA